MRTKASSSKAENALKAWLARILRSARKRLRGASRWLAADVPFCVKKLPCDLKSDGRLSGAGGESEEDAFLALGDRIEGVLDGEILVIARLPGSAFVLEGDFGKTIHGERDLFSADQRSEIWTAHQLVSFW